MTENNIEYSKGITRESQSEEKYIPEERKKEKLWNIQRMDVCQSMRHTEHIVEHNR